METMTYPCSPLIPFPTQHEESSYLLWSPQLVSHHENADIDDMYDVDPSPDDQRQDHEFLAMVMVQDAHDMRQDDFSNADHPLAVGCEEERLLGQEGGNNLVDTVQEELMVVMEESNLADLLIAGAMAVEAGDSIRVSAIMAKIDDILDGITDGRYDASGSSLDHLACYFARVLRSRIGGARTECHLAAPAEPPPVQPANRLPAYQMLQELSPFVKFAHFTANQAILEATVDEREVHVVDLNIGEGSQWSSLMSDLASRHGGKPFRLTALTTGGTGAGAHRTSAPARWLSEFAGSLGLPFRYDEEDLHEFTGSCCNGGGGSSSVIISCDATGMSHTSMSYSQLMLLLLGSVKIMQPKLVILTEDELFRTGRTPPTLAGASFAEFFGEALRHFAAVQESLASCFCDGGYEVCLRLVEQEILGPRIEGCATWPHWSMTGGARDGDVVAWFLGLGFRACGASGFNIAQARMLAGLFSRGFGVMHDKERLALCWKDRPLTSVSIWSPV